LADPFTLDGEPVEARHSDTDDTTVPHVPSLGPVVAGDVVHSYVHLYLAEAAAGRAAAWHDALDRGGALRPAHVVAGHKDAGRPDDIDETRHYLDVAMPILAASPTRPEFFTRTVERFPGRPNPTTTLALRLPVAGRLSAVSPRGRLSAVSPRGGRSAVSPRGGRSGPGCPPAPPARSLCIPMLGTR
jgi:hypothetical protein